MDALRELEEVMRVVFGKEGKECCDEFMEKFKEARETNNEDAPPTEFCGAMRECLIKYELNWTPKENGIESELAACFENKFPETFKGECSELYNYSTCYDEKFISGTNDKKRWCGECEIGTREKYSYKNTLDHYLSYLIVRAWHNKGNNAGETGIKTLKKDIRNLKDKMSEAAPQPKE